MMMKRMLVFLFWVVLCMPLFAGIADDGLIEDGEYDYGVVEIEDEDLLVTGGGGAYSIEARGESYVEVQNTSPLGSSGGITDLMLANDSELLYLGGQTGRISIGENASAVLKSGKINSIYSLQNATTKHIDLYCQSGWSWQYDDEDLDGINEVVGITGLWENDTRFEIDFTNDYVHGYDPVYLNINIIEVPEPVSLVLLGMGGLLLRRKK